MRSHHEDVVTRRVVPPRIHLVALLLSLLLVATTLGAGRAPDAVAVAAGAADVRARPPADTITPAMIALGDDIFHGRKAGGLCLSCHGRDAKGMPGLGPDLTDSTWLHGDGSLEFLRTLIRTGVLSPKKSGGIMPPYGGTTLDAAQLEAVAAYVYSLSHG